MEDGQGGRDPDIDCGHSERNQYGLFDDVCGKVLNHVEIMDFGEHVAIRTRQSRYMIRSHDMILVGS